MGYRAGEGNKKEEIYKLQMPMWLEFVISIFVSLFRDMQSFLKWYMRIANPSENGPEVCIPLWIAGILVTLPMVIWFFKTFYAMWWKIWV